MKGVLRRLLEGALEYSDYVLKERSATPVGLRSYMKRLHSFGFDPKTVVGRGRGYGTPWLYKAFPSARFELFEPLGVFEPTMKRICALGSERTETTIESDAGVPTGSTMAGRDASLSLIKSSRRQQNPEKTKVQVHKLDEFGPFAAPILLKLDVEGFESEVLKGATATLANTDIIISEVSVTQRHKNEMSFGGFMNFMESLGFSLIEFPEFTQVRRDGPLAYVDAAFARSDSPFRR